jgi:hypothetical protein
VEHFVQDSKRHAAMVGRWAEGSRMQAAKVLKKAGGDFERAA